MGLYVEKNEYRGYRGLLNYWHLSTKCDCQKIDKLLISQRVLLLDLMLYKIYILLENIKYAQN